MRRFRFKLGVGFFSGISGEYCILVIALSAVRVIGIWKDFMDIIGFIYNKSEGRPMWWLCSLVRSQVVVMGPI